jgi:hypothetical protein
MGTETSLVEQWCREIVPCREWTTVDTGNLVVRELVILGLGLEPLHSNEVQVPLVGVLPQLTDLQTRVRLPLARVAVTPPLGLDTAHTLNGKVGADVALF